MTTSIMWFRRDLRLDDNPALLGAIDASDETLALFIIDPVLWERAGANRQSYLIASLRSLDTDVDGRLVVRSGSPVDVLSDLTNAIDCAGVWCAADAGPYGRKRDADVSDALDARGLTLHRVGSPYAVDPGTITTKTGTPYKVFTPFSRVWMTEIGAPPEPRPENVRWADAVGGAWPDPVTADADKLPPAGEAAARGALNRAIDLLGDYDTARDRPDLDATSRLSHHLKWGELHPRTVLDRLDRRHSGHATFAKEICWREFYADVLLARPDSARQNWRTDWDLEWEEPNDHFDAWRQGLTGFPIVDAGMRQLLAQGWMHNRVRMITASFLVKDLHIHWRHGAAHFMRHLVDGDLASNQHGWQWTAGTGTDAQPFFRIFNPTAQSKRHDPDGEYIRRWVPELAELGADDIHEPSELFRPAGYPAPIVDHAEERRDALDRYEFAKATRDASITTDT